MCSRNISCSPPLHRWLWFHCGKHSPCYKTISIHVLTAIAVVEFEDRIWVICNSIFLHLILPHWKASVLILPKELAICRINEYSYDGSPLSEQKHLWATPGSAARSMLQSADSGIMPIFSTLSMRSAGDGNTKPRSAFISWLPMKNGSF